MIVLDANILIRAVLGRRVRQLLETWSGRGVRFVAPDAAFEDARVYLPPLLTKRHVPEDDIAPALAWLETIVEPIAVELYAELESEARRRLRDEDDWPVLATALALSCAIWSEDGDFFGTGVAVWTTANIEIFLTAQVGGPSADDL